MKHEITNMKKFLESLYVVINFNELNIIDIKSKKLERTVLFQDVNMTAIHVTEEYFVFSDHFNYVYVVQKSEFEVNIFLKIRMKIWRKKN